MCEIKSTDCELYCTIWWESGETIAQLTSNVEFSFLEQGNKKNKQLFNGCLKE
jgi:hypothetical protein